MGGYLYKRRFAQASSARLCNPRFERRRIDMFEISKEYRFEAAHSLSHLPESHKCRQLHGHSYRFEVVCRGELDEHGFVIDYGDINEVVKELVDELDHSYLAGPDDPYADGISHHGKVVRFDFYTTAENLARWLYDAIREELPQIHRINVYETAKTRASYPVLPEAG